MGTARRIAAAAGGVLIGVATIVLLGWIDGWRTLVVFGVDRAPMRPVVALALLLIGIVLSAPSRRRYHWLEPAIGAIILSGSLFAYTATVAGIGTGIDAWLWGRAQWYAEVPGASNVPVLTGICLVLIGTALLLGGIAPAVGHIGAVAVLFASYVAVIGQLLGSTAFEGLGTAATMPISSALGLGLAALGLLARRPEQGLTAFLKDRGTAGVLVRVVVVSVPIAMPVLGWLLITWHEHGRLDHETLVALLAGAGLLVATGVTFTAATRLRRMDRSRDEAHRQLARTNLDLERRVAERTAQVVERTALFTEAFASAPVGIVLLDTEGVPRRANDAMIVKLGIRMDTTPDTAFALVHPADRARARAQLDRLVGGRIPRCHQELRLRRATGEYLWVSVTASVLHDRDGSASQVLAYIVDIADQKAYEHQLEHLAHHDALTGLVNRRGFDRLLAERLAVFPRGDDAAADGPADAAPPRRIVLVLVDLDRFKVVNDTFGHERGDRLLVSVGRELRSVASPDDVVARIGGDEFAIIMQSTAPAPDPAVAMIAGEALIRVRAAARDIVGDAGPIVTASIGVTCVGDADADADLLLRRADTAMYQAKSAGGDRWVRYDPDVVSSVAM